MATAAEPRPAELPLPGGRDGARVRVHPLLSARMVGPPGFFHRDEGRLSALRALGIGVPREQWLEIPVISFLLEHPGAGAVLIDTGFHPSVAVDPKNGVGRLGGLLFKDVQMDAADSVPSQLRAKGVDPASVGTVLMTHLHSDHASGIAEFPAATFLVSSAEWAAASSARETDGYIRRQFDHAFDYRLLDFDSAATESFASFGRSFDVFGDGSVRMVFTPGHTAGHCSAVIRTASGEMLVAGDAIYTMRTLDEGALPYKMADSHRFRRSLGEIRLYREQTPDAVIVPGHDMAAWRLLPTVL
jgi:N-acyl homoserine lactone hydrolase